MEFVLRSTPVSALACLNQRVKFTHVYSLFTPLVPFPSCLSLFCHVSNFMRVFLVQFVV